MSMPAQVVTPAPTARSGFVFAACDGTFHSLTLHPYLPDNDRTGIIVGHLHPEGECARHRGHVPEACAANPGWCGPECEGAVLFDTPENRHGNEDGHRPLWQVESLEPLTISPSILMSPDKGGCGLHGFIRAGRWEGC